MYEAALLTNCAPLVADLFLFSNERDFMKDLSSDNQANVIKAFNSTSRYLDDLLTLTILILKEWSTKFILLNRNLIKLILQIPRPPFYAPTLKKWGTYWFRLVRVCVGGGGHRDIVLKLHVWISHGKIADTYFWFSLNYLPLLNYGPLTNKGLKFCKCRILKSIIARNLKLVSADWG